MRKFLSVVALVAMGVAMQAQFFISSFSTDGVTTPINYTSIERVAGGQGDFSSQKAVINIDEDQPMLNLTFTEDAHISIWILGVDLGALGVQDIPVGPQNEEGQEGNKFSSPQNVDFSTFMGLIPFAIQEGLLTIPSEFPLRIIASTKEPAESADDFDLNDLGTEVLDFTVRLTDSGHLATAEQTFSDFSFGPNPVKDVLKITAKDAVNQVEVYNMAGQKVVDRANLGKDAEINVSSLQRGVYLMKARVGNQSKTFKVVKE